MAHFNQADLEQQFRMLSYRRLVILGACLCERLLPSVRSFHEETGAGRFTFLRTVLDAVWAGLAGYSADREVLNEWIAGCEQSAPSSEVFDSLYTTAAQEACFALCDLLEFVRDGDSAKIVQIAVYSRDTVDLYVQERDSLSPISQTREADIENSDLMQSELRWQADLLAMVSGQEEPDWVQIRKNVAGKSNLRL